MEKITAGRKAPDFALPTDRGEIFRLSEHKGAPVVLYFYPEDDSGGCTIENIEFSEVMPEFARLGVKVVGISPDSVEKHGKFRDKYKLGIPLVADPDRKAIEAYGLWGEKVTFGHHLIGLHRTTVLVDKAGKVAEVFAVRRIKGHAAIVLAASRALVGAK